MLRIRRAFRLKKPLNRSSNSLIRRWAQPFFKRNLLHAARVMGPTLVALAFAGVAHAQGTMDFSGAQTLMETFKTLTAYLRRADEGTLSRLLVEATIMLAASRTNPVTVLRDAATVYKVDTDTIALKTKEEFAAKEKARKSATGATKPVKKTAA